MNWTIGGRCPSGATENFFFLPSMYPAHISLNILKGATQVDKTTAGWQHSLLGWTLYIGEMIPSPNLSPNTGYSAGASRGFPSLYKENQTSTVIPRLTSDPANEYFFAVFRTRLTNVLVDARADIKQQTWTVGPFHELIFSVCMCVTKK